MLTIEQNNPVASRCDCCGGTTTRLTRCVYKDGDARAVYYAQFSDDHPDRVVAMLVSIGEWGEGATPADRVAFALELRDDGDQYGVGVTDASESPWCGAEIVGRILDRREALAHPMVREAFEVVDQALVDDEPLQAYFRRSASTRPN